MQPVCVPELGDETLTLLMGSVWSGFLVLSVEEEGSGLEPVLLSSPPAGKQQMVS